jgi:hypothetical protein
MQDAGRFAPENPPTIRKPRMTGKYKREAGTFFEKTKSPPMF